MVPVRAPSRETSGRAGQMGWEETDPGPLRIGQNQSETGQEKVGPRAADALLSDRWICLLGHLRPDPPIPWCRYFNASGKPRRSSGSQGSFRSLSLAWRSVWDEVPSSVPQQRWTQCEYGNMPAEPARNLTEPKSHGA
ncbi:hypothetical protein DPEC_G00317370 [Dallia pectoralis]|uniref:Uncharacterized protein n=1 Tax=Dallia pectoralis TaxID=75939 RepID=A0ACC2FD02_DALPE|nr:hypothetical protein DPEC_G00317370 [Dallia pectoralis]